MSDDDNKIPTDKEKQFTLRANLSMNAEDGTVGPGLMAVHMDRGLKKLQEIEKKKQRAEKRFNAILASIEAQIEGLKNRLGDLENERNDILEEMAEIEKDMPKNEDGSLDWEEIAGKEGIERKEGETPDEFKKRAIKELQAKKDSGELDPNSAIALWLDANNRLGIVDGKIYATKKELENLNDLKANSAVTTQKISNFVTVRAELEEKIKLDPMNQALEQELADLNDDGEEIESDVRKLEKAGEKRYENGATFGALIKDNSVNGQKIALNAMGVSEEDSEYLGDISFDDFADEPTPDTQITAANAISENPIKPETGKLTDVVNLAFSSDLGGNLPESVSY